MILPAVNVLSPPRARLTIEVVYDLVCPWCFLGTRRLRRALLARPEILAELVWRPFLLNPDIGPGGVARTDYLARKFGGEDRARRLHATIAEMGRAEGVPFRFERVRQIPPVLDAHRLVRYASGHGLGDAMVDALFVAYFSQGADLGDPHSLGAIAAGLGFAEAPVLRYLASGAEADQVHADNLRAHRLGINGVPCFVVAERHAIAGAQEPEVLERLLDAAIAAGV
ncbi:DsbA family oxidoreductase [Humitalea rosea]|uniref:DsbA family oxidoreductase n=1 Tax=Humitalea rosea TaxID=990373 RepID=UPI001FE53246|nr:DsbA family oxidoreductase [Humitalea rosea]